MLEYIEYKCAILENQLFNIAGKVSKLLAHYGDNNVIDQLCNDAVNSDYTFCGDGVHQVKFGTASQIERAKNILDEWQLSDYWSDLMPGHMHISYKNEFVEDPKQSPEIFKVRLQDALSELCLDD